MPPKKAVGKKKKKVVAAAPPFPIPRDLTVKAPIDAHEGALGIEHLDVKSRLKSVAWDLVLWKISTAVRAGSLDLELSDGGLDALPDELFELPWLQVLDLSRNAFVNSVFDEMKALPCTGLRALDLSTNLLNGPLPDSFASLPPSLEELSLDENVISEMPVSAAALRELTWLSMRRNLLTAIPGPCLAAWTKLEHLDLRNNKLKTVPEELGECAELRELFLSSNELTTLPDNIGGLLHLEVLHVQKNALTALPDTLSSCVDLDELDASFNKIAVLPAIICVSCTALRTLLLASNKLDTVPVEIAALTQLEVLSLAANSIKTVPEEMGALSRLREVYMNGNPITTLPAAVGEWKDVVEASFKFCKLKALPAEVAAGWAKAACVDVRAKKKDTCKVPPELKDALRRTHLLGVVVTKAKKKKAAKK